MQSNLKELIHDLLTRNIVGAKHIPEDRIIIPRIKRLPRQEQRQFYEEYEMLVRRDLLIRLKKKTGKGDDWHISINPEHIGEAYELIEEKI